MKNFRLAFRSLLRAPVVSGIAILSLALGIGANAAIFSLFERMILRPLPVEEPDRLVNLLSPGPKPGSQSTTTPGGMDAIFSYSMFRDLQAADSTLEGLAAHRPFGANLAFDGDTLSAPGMLVSGSYFPVLRLKPAVGRLLSPEDDRVIGGDQVVVLSHDYWRGRFSSDHDVVGKTLIVNGQPMTIIGVAPRGFTGTTLGIEPKIYVPITMRGAMMPGWDGFENRQSYWAYLFGRLEEGATMEQAKATLDPVYRNLIQNVELELQGGMSEQALQQFAAKELAFEDGRRGQSNVHDDVNTPLVVLLGVTGFVLMIAAANLANLLLVRASDRAQELAIRLSIGARRHQVVLQLLAESFLLAFLGGAAGWLVARGTLKLFSSMLPTETDMFNAPLSGAVWLFAGVLVLVVGLVGLFPALHGTRRELVTALRGQSGQTSGSRTAIRFRTAMATLQIALSVALLASAGLFIRSLQNVSRVELGLDVERLATFGISPELSGYTPEKSRALFIRLEEELGRLPGVGGAAASRVPLVADSNWGSDVTVEGYPAGPEVDRHSNFSEVGPGYFHTVGIDVLLGREFEERDQVGAPKVAVINETFARKFELGRNPIGKRMTVGSGDVELDIEIIGLVRDAAYSEVKGEVPPLFYRPYRQNESIGSLFFYVRTQQEPKHILQTLRGVVARQDPSLPVDDLRTMAMQVEENIFLDRLLGTLSSAFALLATLLAALGLYGVLAYGVLQRRREIGLRMALGADAARVRGLVLKQVAWMTLAGSVVGLLAALGIGRVAQALLFDLEAQDPVVLAGSLVVIALVSLAAGFAPAQRAASVDPMRALREE